MSDSPLSDEERTLRRRLAARANNRAWTLTEQTSRTPEEDREMLDTAHAAMYLWTAIGTPRNLAGAQLLLGQVHALLGNARFALPYAQAAYDYHTANAAEPFQLAISHAILAAAAHCAGDFALHEKHYAAATTLAAALQNEADKKIFAATLDVIPKPKGLGSPQRA